MMPTQQQPALDSPAIEQRPVVERVVEGARKQVHPRKKSVFFPVLLSYLLAISTGIAIVYLINSIFGSPYNEGLVQFDSSLWRLGIPLSLICSFLLGLVLPVLFARSRKLLAVFLTLLFLSLSLVILVIIGLSQLSGLPT